MDWLLMKAGKWGVGKVAFLPEESAVETSTRYDVDIQQQGHKRSPFPLTQGCLVCCLWWRGHVVEAELSVHGEHVQAWR